MRSTDGVLAALLLDETGELVAEAGASDERQRLIGIYQGIALAAARRALSRHAAGEIDYILCRYERATLILRPLRDGYYVVVSLRPESAATVGVMRSAATQARMNEAL